MPGTVARWSRIFLASALATIPALSAGALEPTEPTLPRPLCIPHTPCHLPHPFTAQVDGPITLEVVTPSGARTTPIQVQALAWSSPELEPLKSADPEEGGQVYAHRKAGHGQNEVSKSAPVVYSADPQEGGQVAGASDAEPAQRKAGHDQNELVPASPSPVAVPYPNTASRDAASGLPTGKRMHKPYTLMEPVAKKGAVKVSVLAGACVKGEHIKEATITMRTGTYHLHDIDVAGCTSNGDNTDTCTLTYASLE